MKDIILSAALIVATAGMAAAEVSLNGSGRFGLIYTGNPGAGVSKTEVNTRFRVNFNASVQTDSGVEFGGRIRLQHNSGETGASLNAALLFAKYEAFEMQVGNTIGAIDEVALIYGSEIGFTESSFGDPGFPNFGYYGYNSSPYDAFENNRMGVAGIYSGETYTLRFSYINPDQTLDSLGVGTSAEVGLSGEATFGQFTVAAAYTANGLSIDNNDLFFIGAAYAINDQANIGLNYIDNGDVDQTVAGDDGRTVTLYGNYAFGATTLRAYIAHNNFAGDSFSVANATDTAFGLGADYDLGGATLSGAVHRGFDKETYADLGVRFDF